MIAAVVAAGVKLPPLMIFYFPDFDTLKLAITSGVVPPAVSLTPAIAGKDPDGHLWLQPSVPVPPSSQAGLHRLGVQAVEETGALQGEHVSCWLQLFPLQVEKAAPLLSEQTPVLFELPEARGLPELAGEILRLGNDRQGFRWVKAGNEVRCLLRVIGPPYYSLLRALDRAGDSAPCAYLERGSRLWVEIGCHHPLLDQIKAPPGKLVLMRAPCHWEFYDDVPYRDIYDILEFPLAAPPVPWQDTNLEQRLSVPLRLVRGSATDSAELWVLRDQPLEQVEALVQGADDYLLARLAFAVAGTAPHQSIILRVRPSKQPPPVLVLRAESFHSYLKLANLFVPCASRLQPPLRRDAVRKLLAEDPARITWLYPQGGGTFMAESLPDEAFRPLENLVDYVLDHDHLALQAWIEAARFDFEHFICSDDQPRRPRTPTKSRAAEVSSEEQGSDLTVQRTPPEVVPKSRRKKPADEFTPLPPSRPTELQKRLQSLEKRFLDLKSPLDAPERLVFWREFAQIHSALGHSSDSTICWVHALWEQETPPISWLRAWAQAEGGEGADLEGLLAKDQPTAAEVKTLAAIVALAAGKGYLEQATKILTTKLNSIQRFLEANDRCLPVRAVWLAWLGVVTLAQGDVLALARTRDRLLERLYQDGLSPDLDLPAFLRFSGSRGGPRLQDVKGRLLHLRELAHRWITASFVDGVHADPLLTGAYADLTFAFGLACLGETTASKHLAEKAQNILGELDDVHSFLLQAYDFRIGQALEGKPRTGQFPPELIEYLQTMERMPRHKVDQLRKHSRILEPQDDKLDPYRLWTARYMDEVNRELAALVDVTDRVELARRLNLLLQPGKESPGEQARILEAALGFSLRLGETFARGLFPRVEPVFSQGAALEKQAALLEKALFVAGHFDHQDYVHRFVELFHQVLDSRGGPKAVEASASLAGQCFRGLRKLGLREDIDLVLKKMAGLLFRKGKKDPASYRALLQVAAGWFYFGKEDEAKPIMEEVRSLLLDGGLPLHEQKPLACSYAATLAEAPAEWAHPRLAELFLKLEGVQDSFTTNSHYQLSKLTVIEAVVLAFLNEESSTGGTARRWLDDDEYLVRRRIHRDVRTFMTKVGF